MIIGFFQSSISAVSVLKSYRYDWNTYYKTSMNCQRYNYINPLLWYRYDSYSEYKVDSGLNGSIIFVVGKSPIDIGY